MSAIWCTADVHRTDRERALRVDSSPTRSKRRMSEKAECRHRVLLQERQVAPRGRPWRSWTGGRCLRIARTGSLGQAGRSAGSSC
jgi:hypothetical protein